MGATVAEAQQKKDKKKDKKDKNAKAVSVEEPQAGPSNAEDATKEKKKKRSKELKGDADSAEGQDKRKKKRAVDEDEPAEDMYILVEDNSVDAAHEGEKTKKKRKSKSQNSVEVDEGTEAGEGEKKKKDKKKGKKREEDISVAESVTSEVTVDGASKKKSKKRKDRKADDSQDAAEEAPEEKAKPKKKRKRSKSGFPDPEEDESLSEQARKALSYAYLQAEEPSSWKFNKARQNWLLRNIWSEEAIPDAHVPLTKQYLSGVQGGVRETLIKTCREVLATKPLEEPKPQAVVESAPAPAESAEKTEKPPVKTKVKVKFDVPEESTTAPDTLQLKQRRAKELLEVLTGEQASED